MTLNPPSAGAPSRRSPHHAPFQRHHSILANFEALLLQFTTTTLSCLVHLRPKAPRDHMINPRGSETHRRQNRPRKEQQRKFGCSKPSWPRHVLTPLQLLRLRRSVSRPDLAGALIDFVRVSILLYIFFADCYRWRYLNTNVFFFVS